MQVEMFEKPIATPSPTSKTKGKARPTGLSEWIDARSNLPKEGQSIVSYSLSEDIEKEGPNGKKYFFQHEERWLIGPFVNKFRPDLIEKGYSRPVAYWQPIIPIQAGRCQA